MPIEIRELLIRTTIESNDATKKPATGSGEAKSETAASPNAEKGKLKEQLVRECVNVIMDNLSSYNKER